MRKKHNLFPEHVTLFFPFLRSRKKKREYIRNLWQGKVTKEQNFDQVSIYHQFKKESGTKDLLDDRTWQDLDMDRIFSRIDTTAGAPGRQFLYHLLRTGSHKSTGEIREKHGEYKKIAEQTGAREQLQLLLNKLDSENAYLIPFLFFEEMPDAPGYRFLFYISALSAFTSTILTFFYSPFILGIVFFGLINIFIHLFYGGKLSEHLSSISHLSLMMRTAIKICKSKKNLDIQQIKTLRNSRRFSEKMQKGISYLLHDPNTLDEIQAIIFFYLNMICLLDIFLFFKLRKKITANRQKLLEIFEAIASIDASISISSYLERVDYYAIPCFNKNREISFTAVYHPLLEKPEANSIDISGRSVMITGSNMAGKTTFIKTIGVNTILARALFFCLARQANIPELTVKAMIRRDENIEGGKSNFFDEVEHVREFLEISKTSEHTLFLIDEIFRGTNTVERVSSSEAVLSFLGRDNFVFVTTHDVELQELLEKKYIMYHFSEKIIDDLYTFDYQLKQGPCRSRNAIRLLQMTGYPDEIVKNLDGNEFRLRSNGTMTRKEPFYKVTEFEGKVNIRMFARTESEARKMLKALCDNISETLTP